MGWFKRRRIKRPLEGHAEIVEAWRRNPGGDTGNCRMKLALDVPGIPPQVVDHHELNMTANRWPEAGMRVAVTVDGDDPRRVSVDWDSVFGERYGGALGIGAELAGAAVGLDLDLSKGQPSPHSPKDTEAMIRELSEQYQAGAITYEEMTEGVKRVVGM